MSQRRIASITAVCLAAVACGAAAQPAVVDAVQSPAWLERGGRAVPLAPGIALQANDRLLTGGNGRVRLKLSEGSAVKLGEKATFVFERAEDRGVFKGALAVLAGAFRFTTSVDGAGRAREVAVKVKNVSIGIRGTDLWGKSTESRDWVVLLEGRISVASGTRPAVTLEKPNEMFVQDAGQAPQVVNADPKQVAAWSEETEIARDAPSPDAAPRGWKVVVAVAPKRDEAREMVRQLRSAGFPAEARQGERYHEVEITRLESEAHAREVMGNLRGQPGVLLPKVVRVP